MFPNHSKVPQHLYGVAWVISVGVFLGSISGVIVAKHNRHVWRQQAITDRDNGFRQDIALQLEILRADPQMKGRIGEELGRYRAAHWQEVSATCRAQLRKCTAISKQAQAD